MFFPCNPDTTVTISLGCAGGHLGLELIRALVLVLRGREQIPHLE